MCGGGGGGSYTPPPVTPPPAPSPAPTIDEARDARQKQDDALARKGRAANILTGSQGDLSAVTTKSGKTLLGS